MSDWYDIADAVEEWTDSSDPTWPRSVTAEHVAADADHEPVPVSEYDDDTYDNCSRCGLAVTSDGRRHGSDAV